MIDEKKLHPDLYHLHHGTLPPREKNVFPKRRQERVLVTFLLISLVAVSCAAVSESATGPALSLEGSGAQEAVHSLLPAPASYHFLQGYMAELSNDLPKAMLEYRAALQYDPESAFLRVRLAALYFSSGNMRRAVESLDHIRDDLVQDAAVLTQMANMYAGAGNHTRALALYDGAVRVNPKRAQTYFDKGVVLLNLKRNIEAEETFTQGMAHAPRSHLGFFYRGKALEAQGKTAEAKEAYRQAVAMTEQFEPAYRALIRLYEADGDVPRIIELSEQFLSSGTLRVAAFRKDFVRFLLKHKHYDRAVDLLDDMILDDPTDLNAQIRKALVYAERNDSHRAIEDLKRIIQTHPSALRVRDYLGLLYEQIDDVEQAIDAYRTNVNVDATFYDSRVHLGYLLYRLTRYEEAVPHLTEAVALNPDNPETHLLLGLAYLQAKQFDQAASALEEGLNVSPTDTDLRFNLGAAYDKLNRFSDVVREMEAVLTHDPDHADALNYLGYSYADRGINGQEAVELTQRAVALKPNNGYYIDSLGWALFKVGRVDEARQTIQRAADLVKDDPVIFEHLGEIYLTQDHHEQAKDAWIRSLTLDPKNEKLIRRFQEVGFGDPAESEWAKRRESGTGEPTF